MDEQKKYNPKYSRDPEPWDDGSWQTGSTQPPKDRGGTMALLLILIIFLCGIITVLGILNVRLFTQLQSREENLAYARLLAPYTVHIHVFNWNCPDGKTLEKYPLAEAVDAWKDYMTHFSGEHAMLLEFMPDNRIESLVAEADALREITRSAL